jgi:hypothetical protein
MTKAGKESREERANPRSAKPRNFGLQRFALRSSGLTQTAKVRRPSVQDKFPRNGFARHDQPMSFPPRLCCKRLEGISLPARLLLAGCEKSKRSSRQNN